MGSYNSHNCVVSAIWWTKPYEAVMVIVSSNYAEEIKDAALTGKLVLLRLRCSYVR